MARQQLTELPNLEISGSDYDTTLQEIKNIIQNNPDFRENWNVWNDSTAGNLLTSISAYILDNLNTKQDLLFNEMFLSTASKDESKRRLLKLIGYIPNFASAAKANIRIDFDKASTSNIVLLPPVTNIDSRSTEIPRFQGNDINGQSTDWEILPFVDDKPNYLDSIFLAGGDISYETDNKNNYLIAVEGKTHYEEFINETSDGPYFDLQEKDIAANSIQIYLKKSKKQLLQVNSFVSADALNSSLSIPYVVELNDNGTKRIRFANSSFLDKSRMLPAGSVISVFYRTCNGRNGNVFPGALNVTYTLRNEYNESLPCVIYNTLNAEGGLDQESIKNASLNGPLSLKTMDRAVTPDDYEIILNKNQLIYKSKTYTSTNQPQSWKEYFGRYINPQESFTFTLLNKNYQNVKPSEYNYFPWIDLIKEPRLNEKYIFNNAGYDISVSSSSMYYNFEVIEANSNIKRFNNASILKLDDKFISEMYDEDGVKNDILSLKLATEKTNALFFGDINFSLIYGTQEFSGNKSLTMNNNYISKYDNAKYISPFTFSKDDVVDVSNARYLDFSIDGKATISIDLWVQRYQFITEEEKFDKALDSEGYLLTPYYLKWDNVGLVNAKENFGFDDEQSAANNRDGILQIINKSIAMLKTEGIDSNMASYDSGVSWQFFNLNLSTVNENMMIGLEASDKVKLSLLANGEKFVFMIDASKYAEVISVLYPGLLSDQLEYSRGSLRYLVDWLNYVFKYNNGTVGLWKILADGSQEKIENQSTVLNNLEADFVQVFDNAGNNNGAVNNSYDLVIKNINQEGLYSLTITDDYGQKHTLENVISIGDFIHTNDVKGFVHYIKGIGSSLSYLNYIPLPVQAVETYENAAKLLQDPDNENKYYFSITSPTIGTGSCIIFSKPVSGTNFAKEGLKVKFNKNNLSDKVFGEKKIYLMLEDALGCRIEAAGVYSTISENIKTGYLIFENSCLFNNYDIKNLFAYYKADENNSLLLGSVYENFAYSGDKDVDLLLKKNVVGIDGQSISWSYFNGEKSFFIDETKSNLNVKITKQPVDTNGFYAINSDLEVVCADRVKIQSADITEVFPGEFAFSVDGLQQITVGSTGYNSADTIIQKAKGVLKNISAQSPLNLNKDAIISKSFYSINQICFGNITKQNGNITFYSVSDTATTTETYRILLGTNKTNTNLYKLYPDGFFNEKNVVRLSDDEFYYTPTADNPLVFTYRKLVENEDGEMEGKDPDYFIRFQSSNSNGVKSYNYYLEKTPNSRFPDTPFYVHFINDKTYDYDSFGNIKENDESILKNYMKKYMISGTDIIFLKPYFKTYDFIATVYYNTNFILSNVVSTVNEKIAQITGIDSADINGQISKSQITKAILDCDGVEDCNCSYFGYNADDTEHYKSTEVLKSDFYEITVAHETTNSRGVILSFEPYN